MNGWLWACIALGVVAVLAVGAGFVLAEKKAAAFGGGVVLAVFSAGCLVFASVDTVPTRNVGVLVAFGKANDQPLKNGFHWHAPAYTVETFSATLQLENFDEDVNKDGCQGITVRLGNNTTACADVTLQWNIDGEGDVPELYRSYQSFDRIKNDLVHQQLRLALNDTAAFGTFDPFAAIKATDPNATAADKAAKVVTLGDVSVQAKTLLEKAVGTGIKVDVLAVPIVHYDQATEQRLSAFQQAIADTRIAEQNKNTNTQRKLANDQLAGSVNSNPGVLFQNCLDFMRDLGTKNELGQLPPTFTCPGTGGSGALVTVPAK
jgi:hypothetical protein